MKYPRTKEGYAEYLKSEHWDKLRSAVLARDGLKCVRCGGMGWQVHHRFYRSDWETAQPSDCETLCRLCHVKEHPDKAESERTFANFQEVLSARSNGEISRVEFDNWKSVFKITKKAHFKKRRSPMPRKLSQKVKSGKKTLGCKPWFYSPRKPRYVNRGTSSN